MITADEYLREAKPGKRLSASEYLGGDTSGAAPVVQRRPRTPGNLGEMRFDVEPQVPQSTAAAGAQVRPAPKPDLLAEAAKWVTKSPYGHSLSEDPKRWAADMLMSMSDVGPEEAAKRVGGGFIRGATLGMARPWDEYADTPGYQAGDLLGFFAPVGGLYKAVNTVVKIPKAAGLLTRTALQAARGLGVGAATGTARELANVAHGEKFDPKAAATEAVMFGAFDALLPIIGAAAGKAAEAWRAGNYARAKGILDDAIAGADPSAQAQVQRLLADMNPERRVAGPAPAPVAGAAERSARAFEDALRENAGPGGYERLKAKLRAMEEEADLVELERPITSGISAGERSGGAFLDAFGQMVEHDQAVQSATGRTGLARQLRRQELGLDQPLEMQIGELESLIADMPDRALDMQLAAILDGATPEVLGGVSRRAKEQMYLGELMPELYGERLRRAAGVAEETVGGSPVPSKGAAATVARSTGIEPAPSAGTKSQGGATNTGDTVGAAAVLPRERETAERVIRENLAEIVGADRVAEVGERQAMREARRMVKEALGIDDLTDPEALPRVRAAFDRRVPDDVPIGPDEEPSRVVRGGEEFAGSLAGGLYGFEQDDQGNIRFNPAKMAVGLAAGLALAHYAGKGRRASKKILDGEMTTHPDEPVISKKQAKGTFQLESPELVVRYEAPGAANLAFRSAESARRLTDISGFAGQARDPIRNLQRPFMDPKTGKVDPMFQAEVLRPYLEAKGRNVAMQKGLLDDYTAYVEKELGIRPNTRDDQLVMDFGEGLINESELIEAVGEARARQIKLAATWYRGQYDALLDELNEVRGLIWPGNKSKQIPKRRDYFHHFEDMSNEYGGLLQMFETPAQIEPSLSGVSAHTKPKGKFLGLALPRVTDRSVRSAAGGFARYVQAASYAINIDPQVANLRGFHKALADATGTRYHVVQRVGDNKIRLATFTDRGSAEKFVEKPWVLKSATGEVYGTYASPGAAKGAITRGNKRVARSDEMAAALHDRRGKRVRLEMRPGNWEIEIEPGTKNLNNYIEMVNDLADDLAGKTNPYDRAVQKLGGRRIDGRKIMRAVTWANQRVKANTILANLSSSVAQAFNLPQAVARTRQHMVTGASDAMLSMLGKPTAADQSMFLAERYVDSAYNKFETSWLKSRLGLRGAAARPWVKQGAGWVLQAVDEAATKWMWHGYYRKALAEGIARPIEYADDMTRKAVAGRGVGEVPIIQKSKVMQLVMPFQLEVGNLWWALQDMVGPGQSKAEVAKALATFAATMWVMNRGAEYLRGNKVAFDPIDAMWEAGKVWTRDDVGTLHKGLLSGGRLAGEVLSNMPLGQTAAAMYPEYETTMFGHKLPTRRQLFGSEDPTRFGSGLLVAKGLQDPLWKMLPSFGGVQGKKTYQGIQAVRAGEVTNSKGKQMYPLEGLGDDLRAVIFGKYSTPRAREYFEGLFQRKPGWSVRKPGVR